MDVGVVAGGAYAWSAASRSRRPAAASSIGGLGGRLVWSRVRPGNDDVGAGAGLLPGLPFPLRPQLRLRLEIRYLVAPDVDADPAPGVRVKTSGNPGGNPGRYLFGPHLDTQFVPLLIGLDWLF